MYGYVCARKYVLMNMCISVCQCLGVSNRKRKAVTFYVFEEDFVLLQTQTSVSVIPVRTVVLV